MKFAPGQVVNLKSGGQPLTVVAVDDDNIECMWLGEEGDLFRESIPAVALELAFGDESSDLNSADDREFANARAVANDDDEDEDGDEDDEENEDEDDENEDEEEDDEDEEEDEDDDDEDEEDEAEEDRAADELPEQPAPATARRRRVPA